MVALVISCVLRNRRNRNDRHVTDNTNELSVGLISNIAYTTATLDELTTDNKAKREPLYSTIDDMMKTSTNVAYVSQAAQPTESKYNKLNYSTNYEAMIWNDAYGAVTSS